MKVLVVEDSERLLHSLGHGLTKAGYAVDLATDGKTGLAFAETYDYDAIVLDLMLPFLSGLEVLCHLRKAGQDTHILILSAKSSVEDRVTLLEMGADDYLVKPFSFHELCARLQALVRRRYRAKNPRLASALWRSILPAGASVAKASPFPSRRVSTRCSSFLRIGAGECSPAISYSAISTEATGMYRTTPSRFSSPA